MTSPLYTRRPLDLPAPLPIWDDMSRYKLPDLPYDYDALEPHISAAIMKLHHDKHHAAYVKGANDALDRLADARQRGDFANLHLLEQQLAFNLSGHVLHSIFWRNLSPEGGAEPRGALLEQIDRDLGGFRAFKQQLTQAAATIMGSGWAALCWDPIGRRLVTAQIHDHQSEVTQAGLPLLVIDAWEHAYYLQYKNEKTKFFEVLWNLWNWSDVSARFVAAQGVDLQLEEMIQP
jgi:superoxide dismutase, Fe-Mn family